MQPIGDMREVRERLRAHGYRSVSAWATEHGYLPVTVRRVVHVWGERSCRPHGGISRDVMRALRASLCAGGKNV